ncbi:ArsR/SmtB family transcription factor [Teredinibacter turnerae]|uniref:ArsR/SmtB family transcription factor n=1 Tax=Teredinibacter turnerae TaxID=2426 RepID=UPI00037DD332|nr:metalloregulator ArsR/SmtB family transcription factor [Teredinibacter turnerae]
MNTLDAVFHALGDNTRRAVIARLGGGPASVKELAEPFPMALPSFMKHIAILENSGLITSEKQGRVRTCRLREDNFALAQQWFDAQRDLWESRTDRLADFVENQMMKGKNRDG